MPEDQIPGADAPEEKEPKVFRGLAAQRQHEVSEFLKRSTQNAPKDLLVFTFTFDTADPIINCKLIGPVIPFPDNKSVYLHLLSGVEQWYKTQAKES